MRILNVPEFICTQLKFQGNYPQVPQGLFVQIQHQLTHQELKERLVKQLQQWVDDDIVERTIEYPKYLVVVFKQEVCVKPWYRRVVLHQEHGLYVSFT